MTQLIVYNKGKKIPKFENAVVTTFDEEFEKYKQTCKKKQWRTMEGFSLNFDTCLCDLKYCIFVYPGSEEVKQWICKFCKVLEINEV